MLAWKTILDFDLEETIGKVALLPKKKTIGKKTKQFS